MREKRSMTSQLRTVFCLQSAAYDELDVNTHPFQHMQATMLNIH